MNYRIAQWMVILVALFLIPAILFVGCVTGNGSAPTRVPSTPTPAATLTPGSVSAQGLNPSLSRLPLQCQNSEINCVEGWNGASIALYSDAGLTRAFYVNGAMGDITTTGSSAIGTFNRVQIQSTLGVTNTAVFTPTGTFQPVTSNANVTPTLSTSFNAGTQLLLENVGSYIVTLTAPAVVIPPFRLKALVFDGTNWIAR